MKTLHRLLMAALVVAIQSAHAIPVNENTLKDFRAFVKKACVAEIDRSNKLAATHEAICDCTDEQVAQVFPASRWETGNMSSAADKAQLAALHKKATIQCSYRKLTLAIAKEQSDICKLNVENFPEFSSLAPKDAASACECAGQKFVELSFGTDDTQPLSVKDKVDFAAVMTTCAKRN